MSAPLSPIPTSAALLDGQPFTLSREYYLWLFELWQRIRACVAIVGSVWSQSNQSASIAVTTVATVTQTGLYRINYRLRVTTPGTVSSSLTPTIGWREGAVTQSQAFAALTGNTTTTTQSGSLFVRVDSGTMITFACVYASAGATAMVFDADVAVELIN